MTTLRRPPGSLGVAGLTWQRVVSRITPPAASIAGLMLVSQAGGSVQHRAGDDPGDDGFFRIAGNVRYHASTSRPCALDTSPAQAICPSVPGSDGSAGLAKAHLGIQDAVPVCSSSPGWQRWRSDVWTSNRPRSSAIGQRRQTLGRLAGDLAILPESGLSS